MTKENLSFEEAHEQIEKILAAMNGGKVSLEETIHLFEKGEKLMRHCEKQLVQAELKIDQILKRTRRRNSTQPGSNTENRPIFPRGCPFLIIDHPSELKDLTWEELEQLAEEIRSRIIEVMSVNGGHLSSNLGIVELTIALHRVFDSPSDKFIFDVSHQSYPHKLLTGRNRRFTRSANTKGCAALPIPKNRSTTIFTPAMPGRPFPLLWEWPKPATWIEEKNMSSRS